MENMGNPLRAIETKLRRFHWGLLGPIMCMSFLIAGHSLGGEVTGDKTSGQQKGTVEITAGESVKDVDHVPAEWIREILENRETLESMDMLETLELFDQEDLYSPHDF